MISDHWEWGLFGIYVAFIFRYPRTLGVSISLKARCGAWDEVGQVWEPLQVALRRNGNKPSWLPVLRFTHQNEAWWK